MRKKKHYPIYITNTWILCFTILPFIRWFDMDEKVIAQVGWRTFITEKQGQRIKFTPIFSWEYEVINKSHDYCLS